MSQFGRNSHSLYLLCMLSNNVLFHSLNCFNLDNKLYDYSSQKAHQKKLKPHLFFCFLIHSSFALWNRFHRKLSYLICSKADVSLFTWENITGHICSKPFSVFPLIVWNLEAISFSSPGSPQISGFSYFISALKPVSSCLCIFFFSYKFSRNAANNIVILILCFPPFFPSL